MEKNFIFVNDYETYCYIGVYPLEKKRKQAIKVSVKLGIKSIKTQDKISSTISYEKIIHQLERIQKFPHINLVETLAKKISKAFENISNVNYVKIEIIKKNILKDKASVGYILEKKI